MSYQSQPPKKKTKSEKTMTKKTNWRQNYTACMATNVNTSSMFLVRVFFSAMAEELAHRLNVRKQKFAGVQSSKSAYALSADFVVFFSFHISPNIHTHSQHRQGSTYAIKQWRRRRKKRKYNANIVAKFRMAYKNVLTTTSKTDRIKCRKNLIPKLNSIEEYLEHSRTTTTTKKTSFTGNIVVWLASANIRAYFSKKTRKNRLTLECYCCLCIQFMPTWKSIA